MQKSINNKDNKFVNQSSNQDLGIYDVLIILWSGKFLILFICFFSFAASVIYLNFSEFKYSVS